MKQKIRFPGRLWLSGKDKSPTTTFSYPPAENNFRGFWKEYKYVLVILLIALIVILANVLSYGQQRRPAPLPTGARLPDTRLSNVLNSPAGTLRLSDYRDRLLILDFWSTACATCIEQMPGVAALQRKYGDQIRIIEIDSYDQPAAVLQFYERRPELKALGIPLAVRDTRLKQLFPHRFEPHVVWIDHGLYQGATEGSYLNERTIDSLLHDQPVRLREKKDPAEADTRTPFFTTSPRPGLNNTTPLYGCTFTGHLSGLLPRSGTVTDTAAGTERFFFTNLDILSLYAYVYDSGLPFSAPRRVLHLRDSTAVLNLHGYRDQWEERHTYCFEAILPLGAGRQQALSFLKQSLEACLGINGRLAHLETDCLVLSAPRPLPPSHFPKREAGLERSLVLKHIDLAYLGRLLEQKFVKLPVVCEGPASGFFDLELPALPADPASWAAALKPFGISLVPARRKLELFVLSDQIIQQP
ncbi:MAG TPA: TlpA disulfide reductase family protein [Mucilaginibacter sp.]|nr:TlpA disulfide reductase family protein [Mucilaginibacter sp.]